MHPPPKPLQTIAKALTTRFGQPHAEAWLAEQLARTRNPEKLPQLALASELAPTTHKKACPEPSRRACPERSRRACPEPSRRDALRGRLRPLGEVLRDNIPGALAPISPLSQPSPSRPTSPVKAQPAPLTAAEASQQLIAGLEAELHPTALRLYGALHRLALEAAKARDYHPKVSHVTVHCPLEIVAVAVGLNRTTIWRHVPELKRRGLIDTRPHKTHLRGEVVNSGTLWQVRLNPWRGKRPRLSYEELKHSWRDLEADVQVGRTAYRELLQQSSLRRKKPVNHQLLLTWALPPKANSSPLKMTVASPARADLETVLDVPHSGKRERSAMVNTAAQAICLALGDQSPNFYRLLLWNLLRHHDQGRDYFQRVYTMLQRAQIDLKEGFARKAGALFIARLKQSDLWEALAATPPHRVGTCPEPAEGVAPISA